MSNGVERSLITRIREGLTLTGIPVAKLAMRSLVHFTAGKEFEKTNRPLLLGRPIL